jgi:hypothetical protein
MMGRREPRGMGPGRGRGAAPGSGSVQICDAEAHRARRPGRDHEPRERRRRELDDPDEVAGAARDDVRAAGAIGAREAVPARPGRGLGELREQAVPGRLRRALDGEGPVTLTTKSEETVLPESTSTTGTSLAPEPVGDGVHAAFDDLQQLVRHRARVEAPQRRSEYPCDLGTSRGVSRGWPSSRSACLPSLRCSSSPC